MAPLTEFELLERRTFLGGTDMAALAGVSRYSKPADVFAEKRPDLWPPRERTGSAMMGMGHLIEPIVANLASEALGMVVRVPATMQRTVTVDGVDAIGATRTRRCRFHPWEGASVDRFASAPDAAGPAGLSFDGLLECKWGESRSRWDDMPDARDTPLWRMTPARPPVVPEDYYVQVQWYLHVTGRPWAVLAVLLGYAEFRWYRIDPDPDLQAALVDLAHTWWHDHVVAGVPPLPDGSEAYTARLRARLGTDDGTQRAATLAEHALLLEYRSLADALATDQVRLEAVKQRIMDSMGTASRIDAPGASVTWRQNKPSTKVDWQAVARDRAADYETPSLTVDQVLARWAEKHTTITPGARPLRVTISDDEEGSDAAQQ